VRLWRFKGVSMVAVPMLADFGVRLAFGLIVALTWTSWRAVPLRFFRLQSQIALGVLVLAALSQANSSGRSGLLWPIIAGAVCSYLASVTWGLGLPPISTGLGILTALFAGAWMVLASRMAEPGSWSLVVLDRATSGILLGATLHSMLLGHHYLVAPAMTTAPLTRSLDLIAAALASRCVLTGIGVWTGPAGTAGTLRAGEPLDATYLAMRWGMGLLGAGVSVYLARRTAAIRSTQSATGILYITTIFVLFGELASMTLSGRGPIR
jgi:hypothetical protein